MRVKKMKNEGSKPILTLRVPVAMRDEIEKMSEETELPISAILRRGVRAELERYRTSGAINVVP